MQTVQVLDRRVMTAREAARQLRIPETTLINWLEGFQGRGTRYPPVLREEPTGSNIVTWGEIVEARYLRAYRQQSVSLQQLRPVIGRLREEYGLPYPLAHFKPFVGPGRELLLELQEQLDLPESLRMVYELRSGQLLLDPRLEKFLERVDFAETEAREARRLRPAGRSSPVVMDPLIKSAASTVRGVRTEILAELAAAGMTVDEITEDFPLDAEEVRAALAYEWTADAA